MGFQTNEYESSCVGEEPNDDAQVDTDNETVLKCNVTEEVVQLSSEKDENETGNNFEIIGTKIEAKPVEETTPLGSKFGESGERIRSARIKSARSAR